MKIKVFQSDKGDCFLISNKPAGKRKFFHMLVDGGMRSSYTKFVAPSLFDELKLNNADKDKRVKLNLVYVSHIDQDHISGVLQLFDDLKDWRVYDFRKKTNPGLAEPASKRPPEVEAIWHNAFHEQVGDNAGQIENMLAATATILSGATDEDTLELASGFQNLFTSEAEAVQLSRRLGAKQLDVPLNQEFKRHLMCVKPGMPAPIKLGGMDFYVLAPAVEDLELLRKEWNEWLVDQEKRVRSIQKKAVQDEKDLMGTANAAASLLELTQKQASNMKQELLALSDATSEAEEKRLRKRLGKRQSVTAPNLASLMVLVEAGNKKILLTGDGHSDDILKGLEFHKKLDQNDGKNLHVNILKVQHHGAEHNIDVEFCQRITADHYIFCGNGEHQNPDFDAVRALLNSRLDGGATKKSVNKEVDNKFTLWFNSSESETEDAEAKEHMRELQKLVEQIRIESKKHFDAKFLKNAAFFEFELK
jgi:beta-lactamase superfamily II metal-dependent hydrolase